jgi:hypothetical protein
MKRNRFRFGVDGFLSVKKTFWGWWRVTVKEPIHFTLIVVNVDTPINAALAATLLPLNGRAYSDGDCEGEIFAEIKEEEIPDA